VRVLVVTVAYPTEREPVAGVFVREQALAVAERTDVTVLHLARGERWGLRTVPGEPVTTWRAGFPHRPAAAGLAAAAARAIPAMPPHDVIHAHFFLAAAPVALLRRRPLVVTEHWSVFLPEDPMQLSPLLRASARFAFARADAILAVSEALRAGLVAHGVHTPIEVLPNSVDTSLFAPGTAPRNGRLLTVGLFYEAKGYEVLLQALARLGRDGRRVDLDIVGDGPEKLRYQRLAADLDISDRVAFHGVLPRAEVAALMARSELFVLASRYDNNPVSVIEAMASGLPVVATAVGGVPELVDESVGRLAPPGDPAALADNLARALDGIDEYDRSAIAARATERYGREAVLQKLLGVYERLVK
jgi:glycosyltransferase involved in cell wall biosynthesis